MQHQYFGKKVMIATMHGKEAALKPALEDKLGLHITTPEIFDTDIFGTFSGEIPRLNDAKETAKQKCLAASLKYGESLVIASEGSFGPHPEIGFLPFNTEILYFMDVERSLEVSVIHHSFQTNFNKKEVQSIAEVKDFLQAVGFPEHKVILVSSVDGRVFKDLADESAVLETFSSIRSLGPVWLETDMRAMNNPSRMKVISEAAFKLAEALLSQCPSCHMPGFQKTLPIPGLICKQCAGATSLTKAYLMKCSSCAFETIQKIDLHDFADPQYCDYCNP